MCMTFHCYVLPTFTVVSEADGDTHAVCCQLILGQFDWQIQLQGVVHSPTMMKLNGLDIFHRLTKFTFFASQSSMIIHKVLITQKICALSLINFMITRYQSLSAFLGAYDVKLWWIINRI